MKHGILYVMYIMPVFGFDFCSVLGTEKYLEKSRLRNLTKQKCEYEARAILSNEIEPFTTRIYDDKCRRQLLTFSEALHKSSLWAVQMFDSSAKTIWDRYEFGHFDECIDTDLGKDTDNIRGKYCLVDLELGKRASSIGICIPNECGEQEIQAILRRYHKQIPGDVEITGSACKTDQIPSPNTLAIFLRYAIVGLLSWTVIVTAVDLITPEAGKLNAFWGKAAEIFSCYRNLRNLTDVKGDGVFSGVHILKVATISLIIFCKRYQILKEGPVKNPSYFEQEGIVSINQISDLLIFQSGFLAVQKLSAEADIGRRERCFTLCAARILRLIPIYAAVIVFYASILEGSGNGPVWAEKTEKEARHCRDFWWANLSFINNYISSSRQCIAQSWYLAVIAHCSLLTLIFIHLATRESFVGLASFGVTLATAVFVFVWNDLRSAQNHLNRHEYIIDTYTKTHNRVPAYAIGGASAFLCNYIKKRKDVTQRAKILLLTFAFGICGLISIISSSIYQEPDMESMLLHSLTKSLSLSVFIACIYITSSIYNLSIHKITKNVFVPLSRLSYSTILVFNIIQVYTTATMRVPEYVTFPRLLSKPLFMSVLFAIICGVSKTGPKFRGTTPNKAQVMMASSDIFASYALASVLYLIIEGPTKSWIYMICENKGPRKSVKSFKKEGSNTTQDKTPL